MNHEELKTRLGELHDELEQSDDVSADTLPLLRQLSNDLDRLLEDNHQERSSIIEKMKDALLAVEARHPKVHLAVNRVSEALSKMGI